MKVLDVIACLFMAFFAAERAAAVSLPKSQNIARDVCAAIDTSLVVTIGSDVKEFGPISVCLCLSGISDFLNSNSVAKAAVDFAGKTVVTAELTGLIQLGKSCGSKPSGNVKRDIPFVNSRCPSGYALCGIQSAWSKTAYECVDIDRDLESCGGCTVDYFGDVSTGRDCSAIDGVEDVSCKGGRCEVYSCRVGFEVSRDGSDCVELEASHDPEHHHTGEWL